MADLDLVMNRGTGTTNLNIYDSGDTSIQYGQEFHYPGSDATQTFGTLEGEFDNNFIRGVVMFRQNDGFSNRCDLFVNISEGYLYDILARGFIITINGVTRDTSAATTNQYFTVGNVPIRQVRWNVSRSHYAVDPSLWDGGPVEITYT